MGIAAVSVEMRPSPARTRRAPVPLTNSSPPPGLTLPEARRATFTVSTRWALNPRPNAAESASSSCPYGGLPAVTNTWSSGVGRSSKKASNAAVSLASNADVLRAVHLARRPLQTVGVAAGEDHIGALGARPVARVSSPMPALPPMTTTVCPRSSGSRPAALITIPPR